MNIERAIVAMALVSMIASAGLGSGAPVAAQLSVPAIHEAKAVDLTYAFDASTIYWPTAKAFEWHKESWGPSARGYFYAAARYAASEHGGTHLDSPIHFYEGRATVDEIPVEKLMGPAMVIDISAECSKDPDCLLVVTDIENWEKQNGPIPNGAIVLVRTGWGKFWPDKKKYLGDDTPGETANLHFPGIAPAAARFLAERKVDGVGIDTASLDHGPSKDFFTHQVLGRAGIYGLENVANLEQLPATGATVIAMPMKIKGGSGAPARILALVP
ncbi:MAG: cyclase family protein [Acidobacteria bacterium]|nr:cyclase family protein [Acidobacteriota bacterium]